MSYEIKISFGRFTQLVEMDLGPIPGCNFFAQVWQPHIGTVSLN
jgi:hypothetical protein